MVHACHPSTQQENGKFKVSVPLMPALCGVAGRSRWASVSLTSAWSTSKFQANRGYIGRPCYREGGPRYRNTEIERERSIQGHLRLQSEFEANLGYAKRCLKKTNNTGLKKKKVRWAAAGNMVQCPPPTPHPTKHFAVVVVYMLGIKSTIRVPPSEPYPQSL